MKEPVLLVEVTRSGVVECRHRGSIAVIQDGKLIDAIGDPDTITPERSTAKPFQLLALLKHGGIERFGLTLEEIAVMVSSHNAEPAHVRTIRGILRKGSLDESLLGCGAHPPFFPWIAERIFQETGAKPQPIHNNCSGNHTGMLLLGTLLDVSLARYVAIDHPVQQEILKEIATLINEDPSSVSMGIDGCNIPTYNVRLTQLASAFCKFAMAEGQALATVRNAMMTHPFMVGGSTRIDTDLMQAAPVAAKAGALGVYCIAVPAQKLGIAIKIESGSEDASGCAGIAYLRKQGLLSDLAMEPLLKYSQRPVTTCTGTVVGHYRAVF